MVTVTFLLEEPSEYCPGHKELWLCAEMKIMAYLLDVQ
jgi:hypothetical protein